MKKHNAGKIIYTREQIHARLETLVDEIAAGEPGEGFVMIGILRGSFMFMADLLRAFNKHNLHPQIDFISLASYGSSTVSNGTVRLTHDTDIDVRGKNVLLVDDILDTGHTLAFAKALFRERGAKDVKACVLLDKKSRRTEKVAAEFIGFPVDDLFVVGYGLDFDNRYRELPHIAQVEFED